jgi:hypothetical protein
VVDWALGIVALRTLDKRNPLRTPVLHTNLAPRKSARNGFAVLLLGADQRNGQLAGRGGFRDLE